MPFVHEGGNSSLSNSIAATFKITSFLSLLHCMQHLLLDGPFYDAGPNSSQSSFLNAAAVWHSQGSQDQ